MNKTFSLLFLLKKKKVKANGTVPLYARITIDGIPKEISCKRSIDPDLWDSKLQRLSGRNPEVKAINSYLKTFEQEIYDAHHMVMKDKVQVTSAVVKAKATGADQVKRMLVPIFKKHNSDMKVLVEKEEYAEGTLERYETSLNHTIEYMQWKYKKNDIEITEINYEFVEQYDFYLRTQRDCCNNTTVKYLKNFQKIVHICLRNKWIEDDPFINYNNKVQEVEISFLSEEQISTIYTKRFVSERLEEVRDIFVFCCFTGLAYIDVKQLNDSNIAIGIDGLRWIYKDRQKTDTASNIPILPIAQEILDKYANHPACLNSGTLLPVKSNQKMNSYLKEIADVCGIDKKLTFHVARYTFATTVTLTNGVPMESVSKMLGHKSMRMTQHYAQVVDRKVSNDMMALRDRLSMNNYLLQKKGGY
jgi:site-specific recombinase XerD